MKRMLILASLVCLAAPGSALAQYPARPAPASSEKAPAAGTTAKTSPPVAADGRPLTPDGAFVAAAAQSGLSGVTLGRMAAEKASRPEVKRFAQQVVDVAGRMSEELKPLLKAQNLAAPSDMDQRQTKAHEMLTKLSGEDFDRAFVSSMLASRSSDVMVFQRASMRAHDSEVKAWAVKMLPILQEQQEAVNKLR
jgi:putative membrane protein